LEIYQRIINKPFRLAFDFIKISDISINEINTIITNEFFYL
jgi:hypothetical protein